MSLTLHGLHAVPAHPVRCSDGLQAWSEYCTTPYGVNVAHDTWGVFCALYLLLFIFYMVRAALR